MRNQVRKAFTLVEILIVVVILGILAAIVIPQFTSASQEAQVGNVQTQLQTIRSQIELFRVRNNGTVPVLLGDQDASFEDLLRGRGNTFGLDITNIPGREQDPYTRTRPVNPRTGTNEVITSNDPRADARVEVAAGDAGWLYDPTTGEFAANGFDETTNDWFTAAPVAP